MAAIASPINVQRVEEEARRVEEFFNQTFHGVTGLQRNLQSSLNDFRSKVRTIDTAQKRYSDRLDQLQDQSKNRQKQVDHLDNSVTNLKNVAAGVRRKDSKFGIRIGNVEKNVNGLQGQHSFAVINA
eukprot:g26403.t1